MLPSLRTYNDLLFRMSSKVNTLTSQAHDTLDNWNRLAGGNGMTAAAVQKEVGELALDAGTLAVQGQALPATFPADTQVHADLAAFVDHLLGETSSN